MDIKVCKFDSIKEFEIFVSPRYNYPFASMDVGDFFEIPDQNKPQLVASSCCSYGKKHKKKFSVKTYKGKKICVRIE